MGPTTFCLTGPHGTHLGTPTWAFPCWSQLGPIFIFTWDTSGHSHLGIPMLVPIGAHLYFHMGHAWAFPHGQSHEGPNWDPSLFSYGTHLGIPMLVPIGTHLYFHMGHTWAFPLGHSHVGPNWEPSLFSHGTHLGIPTWVFPCRSQLGPIFIFIWDPSEHSHLGIPMYVPIESHFYFHMGPKWVLPHVKEVSLWCHFCAKGVSSICHGVSDGYHWGVMDTRWGCQGDQCHVIGVSRRSYGHVKGCQMGVTGVSRGCHGHVMGVLRGCHWV